MPTASRSTGRRPAGRSGGVRPARSSTWASPCGSAARAPPTVAVAEAVGAAPNFWQARPERGRGAGGPLRGHLGRWPARPAAPALGRGGAARGRPAAGRRRGDSWLVFGWPVRARRVGRRGRRAAGRLTGRPGAPRGAGYPWAMEFRRINGLPPYVFATINDLKLETRRAGQRRHRPRVRQPRPAVARRRGREARRGRPQPAEPPLLVVAGHPQAAPGHRQPLPAALRGRARPRHRGGDDDRRQGGAVAPDVGAGRARATPPSCPRRPTRSTSTRRSSPGPTSVRCAWTGPGRRTEDGAPDPGEAFFDSLMETWESAWPKPRVIVLSFPHNPTTACVDFDVHGAPGPLRPGARGGARPRLRLRRHRLRRLRAAVDPPGARGQGRGGRAVHDDQVVLDGRLAGRASWSATPRSSRR